VTDDEVVHHRRRVHTPSQASKQLVNLLSAPLEAYDVVSVLSLGSYPKVRARGLLEGSSPPKC
jgi:hypothetical protein